MGQEVEHKSLSQMAQNLRHRRSALPETPVRDKRRRRSGHRLEAVLTKLRMEMSPDAPPAGFSRSASEKSQFSSEIADHILWFVDAVSAYLTQRIAQEVSLSAKFLWTRPRDHQPVLHTLCRSTNTRAKREAYDPANDFSYFRNTAFKEIIEQWPDSPCFASNNLFERWLAGTYENANRDWMSFYNSTIVVPIPPANPTQSLPVGFLCADSLLGRLDQSWARSLLAEAAGYLYNVLAVLFSGNGKAALFESQSALTPVHLPCGWLYREGALMPSDADSQGQFQHILERLDKVFWPERYAPGDTPEEIAHPVRRAAMSGDDEEPIPDYDDMAYEGQMAKNAAAFAPEPREVDEILTRMSRYNPDAVEALKLRQR